MSKLKTSLRTIYTTGLCLGLMEIKSNQSWKMNWAGESTYLSAVLSIISGKSIYIGQWLNDIYKISYSCILGSLIGVSIGLLNKIISLQLILLFLFLVLFNRNIYWDHLTKVIASLTLVLGTLRPHISGYGGIILLKELLALIIIPFLITGITLLLPYPSLACNQVRMICSHICDDFKETIALIENTFKNIDSYELFAVKLEHLFKDIELSINELNLLKTYINNEALVFRKINHLNTILSIFIDRSTQLLNEVQSCKKFLNSVSGNNTQYLFAKHLSKQIENLCIETKNILDIIKNHFLGIKCDPYPLFIQQILKVYYNKELNQDEENANFDINSLRSSSKKLFISMEDLFNSYQITRLKFLFRKEKSLEELDEKSAFDEENLNKRNEDIELINTLKYENDRLALRNLGPRMAFLHSLTSIAKLVGSYEDILIVEDIKISFTFIKDILVDVQKYLTDGFLECKTILLLHYRHIFGFKLFSKVPNEQNIDKEIEPNPIPIIFSELVPYLQPIKIALSIIIASLFVVLSELRREHSEYAIWSVVVICFIRSNDSSSSFNLGYQRLEGTVIGSVFSYLLFSGLKCGYSSQSQCSPKALYPLILVWIGITSYFREGQRHGYSALVASFTPIVILLNLKNRRNDSSVAWSRIEQTLLGICIYLVIDNLIFPIRVKTFIRLNVLKGVQQVRIAYLESINAVRSISLLNNIMRARNNSLSNISFDESNNDIEQENYKKTCFTEFRVCADRLSRADEQLLNLNLVIKKINELLKLSANEPELYHKPFPQDVYYDLNNNFASILKIGKALTKSIFKLSNKLQNMSEHSTGYDDITLHLSTFDYFINHILLISDKSDQALKSAYKSLRLLYEHEDDKDQHNLDDIVTLARTSEKLLIKCDEHFRINYLKQQHITILDPRFLMAWQNCFELSLDFVNLISNLGISLLNIREVEAHNMKIRKTK